MSPEPSQVRRKNWMQGLLTEHHCSQGVCMHQLHGCPWQPHEPVPSPAHSTYEDTETWWRRRRGWNPLTQLWDLEAARFSVGGILTSIPCSCPAAKSSDSLWPHGLQHTSLPCPPLSPRVCSNSCPLSQWCHPTFSFSVVPFSSCLRSFPASGSFPMSRLFTSGSQSIGASASASIFPMNIQGWLPLGLTGWISLQSKGLSRVFSSTTVWKHQFFSTQPSWWSNSHIHTWLLEKP